MTVVEQNGQQGQATEQASKYVWKAGDIEMTSPETQEQPRVHGNTKKAADMDLAKKNISPASHKAVHEGRITLEKARELGRDAGPDGPTGPAPKKVNKKDRSRSCMCGCGKTTNGRFAMGHDARVKGWIVRAVREGTFEQLSEEIRAYAAERDLVRQTEQRMADEEAKRAEKAKQKAEAQRKREGEATRLNATKDAAE